MKVVYDWLKDHCGELPPAKEIEDLLTFHAFEIEGSEEVEGETVIDVKVLPDRAADSLSHRGIAHEIAALLGKSLVHDPFKTTPSLTPTTDTITVDIEDPEHCRRFAAALVTGVKVGESPDWLKKRLIALGQRSINNVVDATNYVMLAIGQPLHAYDARRFEADNGVWKFGVRMAREGEEVTTLTGDTYTLTPTVQLIVNKKDDVPVGVAGVKGGKSAEIDETTTDIILESANFDPAVTRRSAQSLRLQTDASKRFENNPSPELAAYGLAEVVKLILEIAGGTCEGYVDVYPKKIENPPVFVSHEHIQRILGLTLDVPVVEDILARLGFTYMREGEGWNVTAPFERMDVTIAEDVIAEIGRVYGYEHVSSVVPEKVTLREYNGRHFYSEEVREILMGLGFSEVITSSFRKKDEISLLNALASDKGCLRSSLAGNIGEVLEKNIGNADLLGIPYVQVFEIGTVFAKDKERNDVVEQVSLALGVRMKSAYTPKDDARLAEVVATLEEKLGVTLGGSVQKGVYECNFSNVIGKLTAPTAYAQFAGASSAVYRPFSLYPYITRDIAFWTGAEADTEELQTLITTEAGELAVRVSLFDRFEKEGRVSYAFRIIFQSFEKTLTDDEVAPIMHRLEEVLRGRGCEVR